ncbi:uncharacterized protein [Aegilops tauschii subsp. strangulata]|uniref:uncharacterized protein n=1 Tax=Aegilops tauschii subsp. strangulata TaxID=200361 RepID=UPI003CC8A6BA
MKLISWNCRGILGAPTVRSLLDIQRRHRPDAFFLSETHLDDEKAEALRVKLQMDEMLVAPCLDGRKGGLLLVWKKEVRIYSRTTTLDFIDVSVENANGDMWRLTGIYGEPNWNCKHRTYQLIRDLHAQSRLPWLVIGDFNEILYSDEKEGGAPRNQSCLQAFQDALTDCSLEDLGFNGDKFTWFRGGLRERLDRAVSNEDWMKILKAPRARLKKAQRELERLMNVPFTTEVSVKQKEMSVLIENLLEQDEIYWSQHGRSDVGEVDANLLASVKSLVTNVMNTLLVAPYTKEEVRKALFQIGDMKAPGPDGLHAIFFKRFWHILGDELTKEVLDAIEKKKIPDGWNSTNIVLIPKVENLEVITQYRPISLCNVVYKIISKMIANRLKIILPDVISPTQSAFVPGRLITDNVLVAYECFHAIKKKTHGTNGFCAVKLDMMKSYDRVEWGS